MKICIMSLNGENGKEVSTFLSDNNILNKYFYDYSNLNIKTYQENIDGIKQYIDSIYADYNAFIEFPASFCFDYFYEKDINTKFIYINENKDDWINKIKLIFERYNVATPYAFEEFFCNHYFNTGKIKMSDLTDQELSDIYDAHSLKIDTFFKNNTNYLKLDVNDIDLFNKIKIFLNI